MTSVLVALCYVNGMWTIVCKVLYVHMGRGLTSMSGFDLHLFCSGSLHSHWTWLPSTPLSASVPVSLLFLPNSTPSFWEFPLVKPWSFSFPLAAASYSYLLCLEPRQWPHAAPAVSRVGLGSPKPSHPSTVGQHFCVRLYVWAREKAVL